MQENDNVIIGPWPGSDVDTGPSPTDSDGCDEEWAEAYRICQQELDSNCPNRGITGGYTNIDDCARGLVSQRCGGNAIN